MNWTDLAALIGAILLLLGAFLSLAAAIGLLRFPDVVSRMHAAAKPQTLGMLFLVSGAWLSVLDLRALGLAVLVVAFQFFTIPVSTHMMARAAYRAGLVPPETLVTDELAEDTRREASRPKPGRPEVR